MKIQENAGSCPRQEAPNPCMLCGEVGRLLHRCIREESEKAGLTSSYRPFLRQLAQEDGLTQLELAQITHFAPPTVSVALQKMQQDGLIVRTPDPEDLRQIRVHITPKGLELHRLVHQAIVKTEKRALAGLSQEEQDTLKLLLTRMRDNLLSERNGEASHETD